jgi:pilus assembly protein FimV
LPLAGAPEANKLIPKSHRWQKTAVAAAAIAVLGLSASSAFALSLGRLTVQSSLGEPLRAEIDVPDINAEEAASFRTSIASPEAFVAAGLEYNAAMAGLQASLQRKPDGRAFIRLSSDRPVNDPFIDMILETSWASGRIVRDYTLLFDPPALRQPPAPTTLAQTTAQAPLAPAAKPVQPTTTANTTEPVARPIAVAKPAVVPKVNAAPAQAPATKPTSETTKQVTVKPGDTASKIAGNTKTANVSLDQMLVALLRANPDAFVNSNINRIRAGAVMDVPSAEQAQSVPAAEASQIVIAQSKDFNDFRRNLASSAPLAAVAATNQKASGTVETKVEDKKPSATTPDKLTLSKGALQGKQDDAKIVKERADKDAQARAAEIAKNIADLKKIASANAPAPVPAPPVAAPTAPVLAIPAVPAPSAPEVAAPAVVQPPVVVPPVAPAPVAAPPVPVEKPIPAPATPPVEPTTPGLVDELLEDPVNLAAAGGLLALLLGGFAAWRLRQRKKNSAQVDSSFLESRLQPDSFFGASGGQRVDTSNEGAITGSSMVYSPSQLDAADDVDPVAEADVYLAYGRDLQAEEILKEAVRTTPGRLAIHTKLLEIFAKRRDAKNFEASAAQAFKITGSNSPDWARICEMGLAFDPENPMYQPGGSPSASGASVSPVDASSSFGSTVAHSVSATMPIAASGVDLDLDLDFSLDDEPASAISDITGSNALPVEHAQTVAIPALPADNSMEMDFDLSIDDAPVPTPERNMDASLPEISLSMDGLSLSEVSAPGELNFDVTGPAPVDETPAPALANDAGMLEFDLGSLSLDLDPPAPVPTETPWTENEDPLETKLALAEEFVSIGDEDGARALIEEVVAEATGDMRAKAQRALANLS